LSDKRPSIARPIAGSGVPSSFRNSILDRSSAPLGSARALFASETHDANAIDINAQVTTINLLTSLSRHTKLGV
jgi:hypothetical protein